MSDLTRRATTRAALLAVLAKWIHPDDLAAIKANLEAADHIPAAFTAPEGDNIDSIISIGIAAGRIEAPVQQPVSW